MSIKLPLGSSAITAFPMASALPSADHASNTELADELNCCLALGEVLLACPCAIAAMSHNITWESLPAEASMFAAVGDQASEETGCVWASSVIIEASGFGVGFGASPWLVATRL